MPGAKTMISVPVKPADLSKQLGLFDNNRHRLYHSGIGFYAYTIHCSAMAIIRTRFRCWVSEVNIGVRMGLAWVIY